TGNIVIVLYLGLGGPGNNRMRQLIILLETYVLCHSKQLSASRLVSSPTMLCQVPSHHHLYLEWFASMSYRRIGIRDGDHPIGYYIGSCLQKLSCNLIQDLSFVRNGSWQNHIKS